MYPISTDCMFFVISSTEKHCVVCENNIDEASQRHPRLAHALRVPPHDLEILAVLTKQEPHEMGIIPLMIECHLAADFLTGLSYMIVDICKEHGFTDVRLMPEIRELLDKCEKFANALTEMCPELKDLIVNNETLNDALHKKYLGYIKQRLK